MPSKYVQLDLEGGHTALFICKNSPDYALRVRALYYMYAVPSFKMKCRFLAPPSHISDDFDTVQEPSWGKTLAGAPFLLECAPHAT